MNQKKCRSPPSQTDGRHSLILACLLSTCKNTASQGCFSKYNACPLLAGGLLVLLHQPE